MTPEQARAAATQYHDEVCPRHANSCGECIRTLEAIILKHASPPHEIALWFKPCGENEPGAVKAIWKPPARSEEEDREP